MKGIGAIVLAVLALAAPVPVPQSHDCDVAGRDFAFTPSRIVVRQNELVRIRFRADDIPHAIAIDEYRINKRAGIGQTIVVEFRADRAGTFPIYCSLTADDRCRQMKGELVVRP